MNLTLILYFGAKEILLTDAGLTSDQFIDHMLVGTYIALPPAAVGLTVTRIRFETPAGNDLVDVQLDRPEIMKEQLDVWLEKS